MRFRYFGETTHDPVLGLLTSGMEGEGDDEVVALKIRAGLLSPAEEPTPPEESRPSRAVRRRRDEPGPTHVPPEDGY